MVGNKPVKNVNDVQVKQDIITDKTKFETKYVAKADLGIYDTDEQAWKVEEAKRQQRLESGGNTDNTNRSKRLN